MIYSRSWIKFAVLGLSDTNSLRWFFFPFNRGFLLQPHNYFWALWTLFTCLWQQKTCNWLKFDYWNTAGWKTGITSKKTFMHNCKSNICPIFIPKEICSLLDGVISLKENLFPCSEHVRCFLWVGVCFVQLWKCLNCDIFWVGVSCPMLSVLWH